MRLAKLLLALSLLSTPAYATTYCVSTTGNDSNTGISATGNCATDDAQAWLTVQKVNNFATFLPDDFVAFKCGGEWTVSLLPPISGTLGHPFTITAYGSCAVACDPGNHVITITNGFPSSGVGTCTSISDEANYPKLTPTAGASYALRVENDYNTIRFLNMTTATGNNNCIKVSGTIGTDIKYVTCLTNGTPQTGSDAETVRFDGNNYDFNINHSRITGGNYGIAIFNGIASGNTGDVENLTVADTVQGTREEWDAMKCSASSFPSNDATGLNFRYNDVSGWGEDGLDGKNCAGYLAEYNYFHDSAQIWTDVQGVKTSFNNSNASVSATIVRYNWFENLADMDTGGDATNISGSGSDVNYFYGNVMVRTQGHCIAMACANNTACGIAYVYNNICVDPGNNGLRVSGNNTNPRWYVYNNIWDKGPDVGSDFDITVVQSGTLNAGNNILQNDSSVSVITSTFIDEGGNQYATDPMYISPSTDDYRLQQNSPAINTGVTGLDSTDIIGTSLPQGSLWDIGAYEYEFTSSARGVKLTGVKKR